MIYYYFKIFNRPINNNIRCINSSNRRIDYFNHYINDLNRCMNEVIFFSLTLTSSDKNR